MKIITRYCGCCSSITHHARRSLHPVYKFCWAQPPKSSFRLTEHLNTFLIYKALLKNIVCTKLNGIHSFTSETIQSTNIFSITSPIYTSDAIVDCLTCEVIDAHPTKEMLSRFSLRFVWISLIGSNIPTFQRVNLLSCTYCTYFQERPYSALVASTEL